ncbi:MAG TPA: LamG-like jellyroll fold domain-containing protein [Verrucomicrobiae bacterium]|nr:LamG-like jellyroll fold domain-containing protein [Verrucomicrobiae bacterium]
MKIESLKFSCVIAASAVLLAVPAVRAQSSYSNAVMSLNPVAYWPLQESAPAPTANVETNLGSLGPIANAYYADVSTNILTGFPGATADGDAAVEWAGNNQSFVIVPTTDNRVSLTGTKRFTVEGWRYATSYNSYVTVACQCGPVSSAGNNGFNTSGGWALEESWTPYRGTGTGNNPLRGWSFHVFNGAGYTGNPAGTVGGAEAGAGFAYNLNQWYYIAGVFDGTNCNVYINGQLATSYQIPMVGSFVPDTWDPIEMGCERGFGANPTHGGLDEVAIYTNALTAAQVLAHYNAASVSSGTGSYTSVVMNDHPVMYWRMDAPTPATPPTNGYPVAMNYGSLAANITNLNTFGTNAVYQPGTLPGVAGPSYSGFGPFTNACAFNGIVGAVDAGYNKTLDPTGTTNNYSVVAWFLGDPTDINNRWNTICSHSDSSWKIVVRQGNTYIYRGAGGLPAPPTTAPATYNVNDGKWHMVVLESCYTNLVSTNMTLVLDGGAVSLSAANVLATPGKPTMDAFIGNGPDYLESTNGFGTFNTAEQTFAGRIAHVAYFTNALTAGQILNLYTNAGATPPPPVIIAQPTTGRTAGAGGTNGVGPGSYIFFGVQATGVGTLAYQWYYNSTSNYNGATLLVDDAVKHTNDATANMTVSNLVNADSGYYYVVITNNYGSTTSILASLSIAESPVITAQAPSGAFNAFVGQSPTLYVTAGSVVNSPLTYQWYTNGVADITSGTGPLYSLTDVQLSMSAFTYQCVVANQFGSATGALNTLTVNQLPSFLTNGLYSSNILSLGPTAYWPMHETEAGVQGDIETNYGTLGILGTGYYGDWDVNGNAPADTIVFHQMTGALTGDSDTCIGVNRGTGSYLLIPRTSPQMTLTPPFSVEVWVNSYDLNSGVILGEGGGPSLDNIPYPSGFDLIWNNSANCFSFVTYTNGLGIETRTVNNYNPGTWYDVVATYTGTNAVFYINGSVANLAQAPVSPMVVDHSSPLTIGGGNWNGNIQAQYSGSIDEVAIYTNLLDPTRIQQHYNAAVNPGTYGAYATNVLADKPLVYMRMDSAPYVAPSAATWPALTNYGSSAISGTYSPGVNPGSVSGPSAVFGKTAPLSGLSGYADAGFNQSLNPVNRTSFSYTFWFKGNPADTRFQNIIGHSDNSWRCSLTPSGQLQVHTVADVIDTNAVYNDGNWHQVVATYNGANSNAVLYVDGNLDMNVILATTNNGSTLDAFLGAAPDYTNNPIGPGRQLDGGVCEVAFFNGVVLSPAQVQLLYGDADQSPYIRQQPISASVNQNSAFTNTVVAGGAPTLSYEWYTNGVALGGATSASLVLNPVSTNNAGNYSVVIANAYGSITSAVVTLTVNSAPFFTSVLPVTYTNLMVLYGGTNSAGTIYAGSSPNFSVSAAGATPLSYQWTTNGVDVGGATNTTFGLVDCQLSSPTNFACVVSNQVGMATNTWLAFYAPAPTAPYPQAVLAGQPLTYWRLNEQPDNGAGNDGAICDDYNGGNNGIYTNMILDQLPGYDSLTDPSEPAPFFGAVPNNCDAGHIISPDFSAPGGSNQEFTVEAWVQPTVLAEPGNGAIISKGYFNQEEFDLDYNGHFRFVVRNSAGTISQATSTFVTTVGNINKWIHLVGVCDEANGLVTIYTNGAVSGTAAITPFTGITNSSLAPVVIGGRPTSSISGVNNQFIGYINDVAVFNYAMNQSQVASQYSGSGVAPFFVQAPSAPGGTTNVTAGTNLILSPVTVEGAPLMTNWWMIVTPGNTIVTNLFTGVTNGAFLNASIVVSNVSALWNGDSVELAVSNAYGGTTSFTKLNVASAPVITADLPPALTLLEGRYYTYNISAVGTQPLAYQWYSGQPPTPMAGQTNTSYTFLAQTPGTNYFSVIITNINGAATSMVSTLTIVANYQNLVLGSGPIAFWPLNEKPDDGNGDDGVIAHDITGNTNNAVYTNSIIGVPGIPNDTNTAALFGSFANTNSMAIELVANPDIAALANANGGNGEFAVEAWVNGPAQSLNARIVDQGHFFAEEWALDCGTTVPASAFRFSVRNAAAGEYDARGTITPDGNWHHLVGVCDEANGLVMLYVDGVLNASNNFGGVIQPGAGIEDDPQPITIGCGDSSQTGVGTYTPEFRGKINNVALYTNVLSPALILQHYQTELGGTVAALAITNQLPVPGENVFTLYAGVRPSFMVGVSGLPPYAYQWYSNGVAVVGATNSVYTPNKVQVGSITNYCIIANSLGSVTSMVWTASVIADPSTLFAATVLSNNPVAYWRLNESGGSSIANDYAGGANGFYGTNTSVGLLGVPYGNLAGETSVGMNNGAPNVAAGSITNSGVILNTNAATFVCWVYPTVNPENNPSGLIFCRSGSTVAGSQIGGANNLDYTWNNVPATYNYGSGLALPANVWSLVALATTPSNAILYVYNTSTNASATNNVANAVQSFANGLNIGTDPISTGGRTIQGQMSEAAIFPYALSASQLTQLFSAATNASSVVSFTNAPPITFTLLNPNQLILNWPPQYEGYYYLEIQTNSVTKGLSTNWLPVGGSIPTTLNVDSWTNVISPASGCVFYRLMTNAP